MMAKAAYSRLSVAQLLVLSTVAALLPAVLFGGYALLDLVARDRQAQIQRLQSTARSLASSVDREIESVVEQALVFAASRHLTAGDLRSFEEQARDTAAAAGFSVVLMDRSHQQLVNTAVPPGRPLGRSMHGALIDRVVTSGQPLTSNLLRTTSSGTLALSILVPVRVEGEVRYVLSLNPNLKVFSRVLTRVPLPDGWMAAVDDKDGQIISRSTRADDFVGTKARLRTPQETQVGLVPMKDLEGRPSMLAYALAPDSGFRAVVWVTEATFFATSERLQNWLAGIAALVVLLSMAAAFFTGRLLSRPVQQLAMAADHLASGQPVAYASSLMREADIAGFAMVAAAERIADRERSLRGHTETTRMLLRELTHRIKNLMAVVSAIGRQTARSSATFDEFARRFEGRVAGLSRSVDLLVSHEWRGVALHDLLKTQLEPFSDLGQFSFDGPPLILTPEATQHLGLALHELATNAAKHGALSGRGAVRATWTIAAGQFRFNWKEQGGPAVTPPERRGFGQAVIETMTGQALMGTARLDFEPDGIRWTLEAPCDAVMGVQRAGSTDPQGDQPAHLSL